MTATLWHFTAMDNLFFRDGSPMNAGESVWIDSLFPPTGQTMQGAIRAAILDHLDADIAKFQQGADCLPNGGNLQEEIGDARSLGNLELEGPFISRAGQVFFPVPLDLVKNKSGEFGLLAPSTEGVRSDLGTIRYPCIAGQGYKTQQGNYISLTSLNNLLQNRCKDIELVPLLAESSDQAGMADREPKIGLARNNDRRQHVDGMLFSIAPVRPRPEVQLVVGVRGVKNDHYPRTSFFQKLGGEGKLAHISVGGTLQLPGPYIHHSVDGIVRFKIVCLSPMLLEPGRLTPDGTALSKPQQQHGPTAPLWQNILEQCRLEVITACIGKAQKIGGWNMEKWRPKPLRPFFPAGSVFFCEADADQEEAVRALHNTKIGQDTEYGFGHILIGKWNYTETGVQS